MPYNASNAMIYHSNGSILQVKMVIIEMHCMKKVIPISLQIQMMVHGIDQGIPEIYQVL